MYTQFISICNDKQDTERQIINKGKRKYTRRVGSTTDFSIGYIIYYADRNVGHCENRMSSEFLQQKRVVYGRWQEFLNCTKN